MAFCPQRAAIGKQRCQASYELEFGRMHFPLGSLYIKKLGAIDLRKFAAYARMWRPFDGEFVASERRRIAVTFKCPCRNAFPSLMPHRAERPIRAVRFQTRFFPKFAMRRGLSILAQRHFALGNKPGTRIPARPKRSTRMDQQHF